jgi:hypothetical protein
MTLIDLLNKYNIPYKWDFQDGRALVDDKLLIPYEEEIRLFLPEFEFLWDYQRYRNTPNHIYLDE